MRMQGELVRLPVLAYCPCERCCGKKDALTAAGMNPAKRGVAVSESSGIPLGAIVVVPGYGAATADDVSPGDEARIEIRLQSHEKAKEWGRQVLEVHWRQP